MLRAADVCEAEPFGTQLAMGRNMRAFAAESCGPPRYRAHLHTGQSLRSARMMRRLWPAARPCDFCSFRCMGRRPSARTEAHIFGSRPAARRQPRHRSLLTSFPDTPPRICRSRVEKSNRRTCDRHPFRERRGEKIRLKKERESYRSSSAARIDSSSYPQAA